jgi:hypothetical protein
MAGIYVIDEPEQTSPMMERVSSIIGNSKQTNTNLGTGSDTMKSSMSGRRRRNSQLNFALAAEAVPVEEAKPFQFNENFKEMLYKSVKKERVEKFLSEKLVRKISRQSLIN